MAPSYRLAKARPVESEENAAAFPSDPTGATAEDDLSYTTWADATVCNRRVTVRVESSESREEGTSPSTDPTVMKNLRYIYAKV